MLSIEYESLTTMEHGTYLVCGSGSDVKPVSTSDDTGSGLMRVWRRDDCEGLQYDVLSALVKGNIIWHVHT